MFKWRQIMVVKPLSDLCEGKSGKIVQIRGKVPVQRYLYEMGLAVGRRIYIKKVENTPLDSTITIKAENRTSTLKRNIALDIRVRVPLTLDERQIPNRTMEYARIYQVYHR